MQGADYGFHRLNPGRLAVIERGLAKSAGDGARNAALGGEGERVGAEAAVQILNRVEEHIAVELAGIRAVDLPLGGLGGNRNFADVVEMKSGSTKAIDDCELSKPDAVGGCRDGIDADKV